MIIPLQKAIDSSLQRDKMLTSPYNVKLDINRIQLSNDC